MASSDITLPFSEAKTRAIVRMLLCFLPLVGMGIDLIAPSLPAINHSLHISPIVAKDLIAIYLMGLMSGTFLSGTLSDTWGRRHLMLGGFILLVMVSILPPLFPYPTVLLLSRLLQGLAIGTFGVLARSTTADLLTGPALLRTASWFATMWGIGPIIGPIIGGYLQVYLGWQANFLFFAVYGLIGAIACFLWLPETHHKRTPFSLKQIKNNFAILLPHKLFVSVSILMGCLYSTLIIFNTLGPFFIERTLGHSPILFGHAAFGLGIVFLCGTFCCRVLIKYFAPTEILSVGLPVVLVFALLSILISYYSHSIWGILIPTAFLFFANGVLYPTCMGATMSMFKELAGSAGGITTLINLSVTTGAGFLASMISAQSSKPIAYTSAAFVCFGFVFYLWAARARKPAQECQSQ
ncbi:MAG: multidrug resistance transporter, Bcr family [Gammaproteobacteria bacterium]|nr:multidrug resistance transporter, Bcr family [Gammaproteobacteria bacterium]